MTNSSRYDANGFQSTSWSSIQIFRSALSSTTGPYDSIGMPIAWAALRQLDRCHVDAEIKPLSRDDALWAASTANAKHGVQLSRAEHLNVFNNYVATSRHIKRRGPTGIRYKSYRENADGSR